MGILWAAPKSKTLFRSAVFFYSMQQQWTISWSDCDMQCKVNFIWQPAMTSSIVGPRRHSRALPKANRRKKKWSHSVVPDSLWPHRLYPTRLLHPWNFPDKSTGVGCHFLPQEIFLTQGSNLGLPHCRQMLYHMSHQGSQTCTKKGHGHSLVVCCQSNPLQLSESH